MLSPKVARAVKDEAAEGLGASPPAGGTPGKKNKGPKRCVGCNREQDEGHCWFTPGLKVAWAQANGRGVWCKDCSNVCRTSFQSGGSSAMMSTWLDEAANRAAFDEHVLAYITLVREGHMKVTQGNVTARVQMLRWFWGATCMDPQSRTIMPLAEIMKEDCPHRPKSISDLTLVTIASESGNQLGAFVQLRIDAATPGVIARPVSPLGVRHLERYGYLASDLPGDFDLMGNDAPPDKGIEDPGQSEVSVLDVSIFHLPGCGVLLPSFWGGRNK